MNVLGDCFEQVLVNKSFQKLTDIGGGKRYHNEGNAFVHTMIVFKHACDIFPDDFDMQMVALLHDVGKVYTGRKKEDGDWEYPYHSVVGAETLLEFAPDDFYLYPGLEKIRFYVRNHIKPLFWDEYPELTEENVNLAKLAICDLLGSYPENRAANNEKILFLSEFVRKQDPNFNVM